MKSENKNSFQGLPQENRRLHMLAHKLFLLLMVISCSLALILFAKSKVEAALPNDSAASALTDTTPARIQQSTTAIIEKSVEAQAPSTLSEPVSTTAGNNVTVSDIMEIPTSSTDVTTAPKETITENETSIKTYTKQEIKNEPEVKNEDAPEPLRITKIIEVSVDDSQSDQARENVEPVAATVEAASEKSDPASVVVVKYAELEDAKNPRLAGSVDEKLAIEKVGLVQKENASKGVSFSGKAEPGAIVKVFVFSDPVIITLKADENGNWAYELTKELEDGKHEAYVAMTDDDGRIVSKSEPIAFVKTAQAATMIPHSELNESPMERSTEKYILIAISIMSVCLVISLVLIGILTHKQNLDEETI